MPTSYTNRVITILITVWIAMSAIYPRVPGSLFWFFNIRGPINAEYNLKPGIDMVGGTSLIYEIKQASGATQDPELANKVKTALQQRVDPNGVRNLIWRPQGANRLEIQMPGTRKSTDAENLRNDYEAAKQKLDATNVLVASVADGIESGQATQEQFDKWKSDSKERAEIIDRMKAAWQQLQDARANQGKPGADPMAGPNAKIKYEEEQTKLLATNLSVGQMETYLELTGKEREDRLAQLRKKFETFPSRLAAINELVRTRDAFWPKRDKIDDVARLKRDLRGSGVLSFNILVDANTAEYERMAARLAEQGPRPEPNDVSQWFEVARPNEFKGQTRKYNDKFYCLAGTDPERSLMNASGRPAWALAGAHKTKDENNQRAVGFEFNTAGAQLFGELTRKFKSTDDHPNYLGIVLDQKLYSAPAIKAQIFSNGIISGDFSESEQEYLVVTLSAGALPAQLTDEPISEITVGPQLGADNLNAGMISCIAGMIIVLIFLVGYYYISGLVAYIAVIINLVLILGSMALINATFTLPGVAGIVLSVAMAVDANVLIFERLREEQARGLSLKMALRNAYERAFSAIFDGQLTTAITSVFLFLFGSEEVRGFGLTLLIGIVTSLFTALFVTRTIFGIMVDRFGWKDLGSLPRTFPRWNEMLTPKVDWVGKAWLLGGLSCLFIAVGTALFVVKLFSGDALDIEFSGGTSVRVELTQAMTREQVQDIADAASKTRGRDFASPRVVRVGTDGKQYEITTPTTDTKLVQQAILDSLGDKLDVPIPSKFDGMDNDIGAAMDRSIFPIESAQTRIEGVPTYMLANHVGGAAALITNIDPPMTEKQVLDRVRQRYYNEPESIRPERMDVQVFDGGKRAVVAVSDSRSIYNAADANALDRWRASIAGPLWTVVKEAINNPPQLKNVTSFGKQVANEAFWNTIIALCLSVLGIMLYIWMRFGDLKFGGATVVACIHDAMFVIAAVGFSHYLSQIGFIEKGLLIKAFRVDLTLVASVLTVVGYSMNDTVVVFDRIRENRGKFGSISRKVINDSVNQTFSRTLLTGGTSLGILLVMYIIGGEGIHGFTFSMLLGIIVGTYSSMVIASPLLLLGGSAEQSVALTKPARTQPAAG